MRNLLAFLIPLALALCACRATGPEASDATGTWTVVELDGAPVGGLARAPEVVIAPDGAISGFTGVNRFSGRLVPESLAEGRIIAGPLAATRMAGPPDAMAAEARLLALLTEPLEWERADGGLVFLQRGRPVVRMRAAE